MNVIERKSIQAAWFVMRKKMPAIKRWLPLVGSLVLVLNVILRSLGYTEAADGLTGVTKIIGLTGDVSTEEIAAIAALVGIVLKVKSETDRARGPVAVVVGLVKRLAGK